MTSRSGIRRTLAVLAAALIFITGTCTSASAAPVTITPGATWYDSAGRVLQAHGAGFFKVGSTYYMVGEDKTAGATFTAVACYSSTDLSHWTRLVNALAAQGNGDLSSSRVVERPKVIYNSATGKYVMWMHIDSSDYSDARAGVATSSTPCGPYTYLGSSRPLGNLSRDLGLFQDTDGKAYLLTEDRNAGLRIDRLSADYTSVTGSTAVLPSLEAPAMVKVNSTYYLFASHLTGWSTNDNVYATASSPAGPWTSFKTFAPAGTNTYNSQTSYVLPITGTSGTSYMFVGDRWNSSDLNASLPIWLPITISGAAASMVFREQWSLDTTTGTTTAVSTSLVGAGSQLCLDVAGNTPANSTLAEIWSCTTGENQQWVYSAAKEWRVFGMTKCLDVLNNKTTPGAAIGIYDCNGGTNQKWTANSDGTVVSVQSGLCLDVTNASTTAGTAVELWTCNGGNNQKWNRA